IEQLERAALTAARLAGLEQELARAAERSRLARASQGAAQEGRSTSKKSLERTRAEYDRAARGVADLQTGLEELHRRAHARRSAHAKLAELCTLLEKPELAPPELPLLRRTTSTRLAELDRERARLDRDAQAAEARSADHERAKSALLELGADAAGPDLYETARAQLSRLMELSARVEHATELGAELEQTARLAERQASVRERALAAGVGSSPPPQAPAIERQLRELEGDSRQAEERARTANTEAEACARRAEQLATRLRELEIVIARWDGLRARTDRLERAYGASCDADSTLDALRVRLRREREQLRHASTTTEAEREALLRELSLLETGTRALHPDLLRLCDELDAELLAERFEDVDPKDAARVEAELGPLVHALLVSDPAAAARSIAGQAREVPSVWLVDRAAELGLEPGRAEAFGNGSDVIVPLAQGTRVTRLSEKPALGRAARQRRRGELSKGSADKERELEQLLVRSSELDSALLEIDRIWGDRGLLAQRDPRDERATVQAELEASVTLEREQREAAIASSSEAQQARAAAEKLGSLVAEAYLLDAPDYATRHAELSERQEQLQAARAELARLDGPRRTLSALLEALRGPPPSAHRELELAATRQALDSERDRWFAVQQLLGELLPLEHAFGAADVESALNDQSALLPALSDQLAELGRAIEASDAALAEAEAHWEAETLAFQEAEAARSAVAAQRARTAEELAQLGAPDTSEAARQRAESALSEAERELQAIAREQRDAESQRAVEMERAAQKRSAAAEVERRVRAEEQRVRPAQSEWEGLCEAARRERVLQAALAEPHTTRSRPSSVQSSAEAESRLDVLCDRLIAARAEDVAAKIRDPEPVSGNRYLTAWLRARDWLKRRLPPQVTEEAEPLEALDRLRSQLTNLEQRLTRQELDLRGTSEDVARSIDVQVRRARAQVRRLNQHLTEVSFGSIAGIRVQMERIDRMDQVLTAFREGTAQELLFHPNLPIEEALSEIFKRYGSGKTGGQRLLDYREYIELRVEVQRQAKSEWEPANPSRLSTGEAIGVGAALMMVVLTEWERDAKFLRPKALGGSLRFLFLDEANRLSQDNLGVLFELCQNLELQLLIAAPEVARATGNTTYRLVRVLGDDGREAVLVSGRRTLLPDEGVAEPHGPASDTARRDESLETQTELFRAPM
ncbi:MAG TPA: SbcC/MukB-like Walker B domain-containing protein, partial [Polyangiaceae bacterium]